MRIMFEALFFVVIVLSLWKIFTYETKSKPKENTKEEDKDET